MYNENNIYSMVIVGVRVPKPRPKPQNSTELIRCDQLDGFDIYIRGRR